MNTPADRWGAAASVGYCCIAAAVVIAVAAVDHLLLNPAGPSALFIDPTAQAAVAQPQQEGKRKLVSSPLLRTPTSLFQPFHTTSSTLSSSPLPSKTITHHLHITLRAVVVFPPLFLQSVSVKPSTSNHSTGSPAGSTKAGGSKGGPSLADLIEAGMLQPGDDNMKVTYKGSTYAGALQSNGTILFRGGQGGSGQVGTGVQRLLSCASRDSARETHHRVLPRWPKNAVDVLGVCLF